MGRKYEGTYECFKERYHPGIKSGKDHYHYCLTGHRFYCQNRSCEVTETGKGGMYCPKCFERKFVEIKE